MVDALLALGLGAAMMVLLGMAASRVHAWRLRRELEQPPIVAPEILEELHAIADELARRIERANRDVLAVLRDHVAPDPDPEAILTVQQVELGPAAMDCLNTGMQILAAQTGDVWEIAAVDKERGAVTLARFI